MVNMPASRPSQAWARLPRGLPLAALLTLGSGLDRWARASSLHHRVSFAVVNVWGFIACAAILWVLRALGVVAFRAPTQATFAGMLPAAAALALAVLAAQQALRYGNQVAHSLALHLVPLLAVLVDFLASGATPCSLELAGCLLTVIGAAATHFEAHEMAFSANAASVGGALARALPALVLLGSAVRAKRIYSLDVLDLVFGCSVLAAAILLPAVVVLGSHDGQEKGAGGALALGSLGMATMVHRVLQMGCVFELGAATTSLSEELVMLFSWPLMLACHRFSPMSREVVLLRIPFTLSC